MTDDLEQVARLRDVLSHCDGAQGAIFALGYLEADLKMRSRARGAASFAIRDLLALIRAAADGEASTERLADAAQALIDAWNATDLAMRVPDDLALFAAIDRLRVALRTTEQTQP